LKILVLNYEYPPLGGGAGAVCQQLSEHYARRGHDVDVVTMAYAGLPAQSHINGVDVTRVPAFRRRPDLCGTFEMGSYILSALPRVTARLRRGRYDVIHCHFVVPTGLLAYLATRVVDTPYVITAHGSDIPGFNPDRFRVEHRFTGPVLRLILRNAALLGSPSRFLRSLILENCGPFPVEHIPNGIDTSRLRFGPKKRRILMTGRLLPRKGFQHVLEALRGLDTDFEVHIAGDGPMRGDLESRAQNLKQPVTFHGWLDHDSPLLTELYETSAIFCLPSETENASISLLEAMLAGMAVVTSNAPGCAETIGDCGFTVPANDPDALRETLRGLFESERLCAETGERARRRVEEHFDWSRIGDRYLERLAAVQEHTARN
jgi:glycosyltransferase involved in cell wall biosynthesis